MMTIVHAAATVGSDVEPPSIAPIAWPPVLAVAAAVAFAHSLIATRYGWHRDEFYFVAAGRHPAWGYVDQPPVTPMLARAAAALGHGLLGLRIVAMAVQAATIVATALVARELGGGRRAQTLAAGCAAGCAVFVGASLFLGTTPVDQLCWAIVIGCVVRAVRVGRLATWATAGVAAGIGLENKHTVAVLLVGVLVGLAARRRDVLRGAGPWVAAVIALALWSPNLWWDASHHWETLDMASALADKQGGLGGSIAQLPLLLVVLPGPLVVFMLIRGVRWAMPGRGGRANSWLIAAALVVVATFTLAGGKPYYSAPLFVPFFALGAVATEARTSGRSRLPRHIPALVTVSAVAAAVISLPYFPASFASALEPVSKEPMETYGWPQLARQVAAEASRADGPVAVYVGNYGEAGALDTYGRSAGLLLPVVAGQNGHRDWGPPTGTPSDVLAVGEFDQAFLERAWTQVELVVAVSLPGGLRNEETVNKASIFRCRGPKGSWAELWPILSYLS